MAMFHLNGVYTGHFSNVNASELRLEAVSTTLLPYNDKWGRGKALLSKLVKMMISRMVAKNSGKKSMKVNYNKEGRMHKLKKSDVNEIIAGRVGKEAIPIVDFLRGKENISEFIIAEKLKIDVHEIRKALYALHSQNLVTYYRKKDRIKGWYISYWTFNEKKVKDLVERMRKEKLEKFKERLEKELKNKGSFFICPNACVRVSFDEAFDLNFRCPECGAILIHQDNSRTIEVLKDKISELEMEE